MNLSLNAVIAHEEKKCIEGFAVLPLNRLGGNQKIDVHESPCEAYFLHLKLVLFIVTKINNHQLVRCDLILMHIILAMLGCTVYRVRDRCVTA